MHTHDSVDPTHASPQSCPVLRDSRREAVMGWGTVELVFHGHCFCWDNGNVWKRQRQQVHNTVNMLIATKLYN